MGAIELAFDFAGEAVFIAPVSIFNSLVFVSGVFDFGVLSSEDFVSNAFGSANF